MIKQNDKIDIRRVEKMKLTRIIAAAVVIALTISFTAFAGIGTTGAQFLKIFPSARQAALAGSYGAIADDAQSLNSNPAGLAGLTSREFSFSYLRYFADINYGNITYVNELKNAGYLGFGFTYLINDQIEARAGDTAAYDRLFNAKDMALTIGFARPDAIPEWLQNLNLGASLKLISSEIDQVVGYTAALDLGALYSPIDNLNVALSVNNISPGLKFQEVLDKLPLLLRLGSAYRVKENVLVALDFDEYLIDNKLYASLGGEYSPVKQLTLRAGYRYGYDTASLGSNVGLSAGIGINLWNYKVDYAFVPYGDLGDTHRVSLAIKF